jgi:hypothetical protein
MVITHLPTWITGTILATIPLYHSRFDQVFFERTAKVLPQILLDGKKGKKKR